MLPIAYLSIITVLAAALLVAVIVIVRTKQNVNHSKQNLSSVLLDELRLRQVLDSASQLMILLDRQGAIQIANLSAMELVAEKERKLVGRPLWQAAWWCASEHMRRDLEEHVKAAANGKPQQFLAKHLNVDGEVLDMDVSISPILVDGKVELIVVEAHDISDLVCARESERRTRKEAEAANRAKSEFLANMSHEIRTPMNAIIGMNRLALKTDLTDRQRQFLESVDGAAKSLLGIINDILDFSKVEAGKLDLEIIPFSLREVFNNVVSMMVLKAEEKGLEFSVNDVGVPTNLIGDPLRLQQILTNICFNAIKFTEKGYVNVTVSVVRKTPEEVRLNFDVEDSGIGLTDQQKARLFDPFAQADSSVTRQYGGTGLGLTISRQLVNALGGEIKVTSEYGKGSRFSFELPFKLAQSSECADPEQGDLNKEGCILVVDDNPVCCQIEEKILTKAGFEVLVANTGEDACELVKKFQQRINLILMDWELPDMNGVEVSKNIIGLSQPNPPPIVMVTAYGQEKISQDDDFAPNDFMSKPITAGELLSVVNKYMGNEPKPMKLGSTRRKKVNIDNLGPAPKVLLVEDNEINRFLACENLQVAGLNVVSVENGQLALDALENSNFDLVLMDLQMPVMDGLESCRHIRKRWDEKQLPVVAITANAFTEEKRLCREVGMNSFIPKPFEVDELYKVVAENLPTVFSSWSQHLLGLDSSVQSAEGITIHGVDVNAALRRLHGSWESYASLTNEFVDEFGQIADGLELLTQQAQWVESASLSHRLKGVAGNLGFSRVCELAQALEKACKEQDEAQLKKLIPALQDACKEVFGAINIIQEKAREQSPGDTQLEPALSGDELCKYLNHIQARLQASEVLENTEIKKLQACLKPLLPDLVEKLIKQIENFHYAAAVESIDFAQHQLTAPEPLRKPC